MLGPVLEYKHVKTRKTNTALKKLTALLTK